MKGSAKKIDWIDGVKAFAIIAILLNHIVESFGPGPWFSNPSSDWQEFSVRMGTIFPATGTLSIRIIKFLGWLGDMGPGVFMLLSGLTLTLSALRKPLKPIEFYRKRLLRIYPLYIAIHLIILIVAKYWFKWDVHLLSTSVILSLLGLRFTNSLFFFINPSWWFIWTIVQMYFLFPFLLVLLKNKGITRFLLITFLVTILSRSYGILDLVHSKNLYAWMTGIFAGTRLFEFSFGMYLGYLFFNNNLSLSAFLKNKFSVLLISFLIYAIGFMLSWSYVGSIFSNIFITIGLSGLFYSVFKLFFEKQNAVKNSVLWIGKNSFSVFLLHQPFMIYVSPLYGGIPKVMVLVAIIVLSFIAGNLIEKLVLHVIKSVNANTQRINYIINTSIYRVFIFSVLTAAIITSFIFMLGFSGLVNPLKILLFLLIAAVGFLRLSKQFETRFFISRFFDVIIIVSSALFLITPNWLSTYWCLVTLAFILSLITFKLAHNLSVAVTIGLLVGCVFFSESYLKQTRPVEVIKWGEFPVLQVDSQTVYSLIPNKTTHLRYNNYNYFVKTNSYGFSSEEINLANKAKNEKRVLVLGDAFSMPEGLDYTNSYSYLLEQQLRQHYPDYKINIINAGVTGYGPNEEYAQLKKYINLIRPDIVINQFFVNEFEDINILKTARRADIGFFLDSSFLQNYFGDDQTPLQLNRFAQAKFGVVNKSYRYNKSLLFFYEKDAHYYDDTVINKISSYFDRMHYLCTINNAKYIVMYVPGQIEVSKPKDISYYPYFENLNDTSVFNFKQPQKVTCDLCVKKNIYYINTTPYLKNYPDQPVYFRESWHWNKEGHRAIAAYLSNYISKNNLL